MITPKAWAMSDVMTMMVVMMIFVMMLVIIMLAVVGVTMIL